MKGEQISMRDTLKALLNGEKITHEDWAEDQYIQLIGEQGQFIDENGEPFGFEISGNWFMYEDHIRKIERLEKKIKELQERLDYVLTTNVNHT